MSRHAMRRGRLRRLTAQAQGKAHHGRHSLWSHKICLRWLPRALARADGPCSAERDAPIAQKALILPDPVHGLTAFRLETFS